MFARSFAAGRRTAVSVHAAESAATLTTNAAPCAAQEPFGACVRRVQDGEIRDQVLSGFALSCNAGVKDIPVPGNAESSFFWQALSIAQSSESWIMRNQHPTVVVRAMQSVFLGCIALSGLWARSTSAQTAWTGTTGDWFTAANWRPAAVPTIGSGVVIANGGTAQITGGSAQAKFLVLGDSGQDGSVSMQGGTLTLFTTGQLGSAGTSGTMTLSGSGTTLTGPSSGGGDFFVAFDGHGVLSILNGATMTTNYLMRLAQESGSTATVLIDGAGSSWTNASIAAVGVNGAAIVTVSNGGKLQNTTACIACGVGSSGNVTVDGVASNWTSSDMTLGEFGPGVVTLGHGGTMNVGALSIGVLASGTLTADGAGSKATATGSLLIGWAAPGHVSLQNGAAIASSAGVSIGNGGHGGGGDGDALVTGATSSWSDQTSLEIGSSARGVLTLQNGGTFSVANGSGATTLATNAGSFGTLNFGGTAANPETPDGALLTASITGGNGTALVNFNRPGATVFSTPMGGSLSVAKLGSSSTLTLAAVHTYTGATTVAAGTLNVQGTLGNTTTTVEKTGVLAGDGSIFGAVELTSGGTISPGNGVGTLTAGALDWSAGGSFAFQLGADDATSDHLALASALTKSGAGTYQFDFRDGNAPPTLATYTLITFTSSNGFSANDFSFTYSGAKPTLQGTFELTPTALLFHVASLPVRLQEFGVD